VDRLSYGLGVVDGLLLAAVFAWAVVLTLKPSVRARDKRFTVVAALVISLAILKVALIPYLPLEQVDLFQFEIWARAMALYGPAHIYDPRFVCNYPPAYLYVLWPFGAIAAQTGATPQVTVELPLVLGDFLLALIVYAAAEKICTASTAAASAALMVAFNPALIYISAVWGQNDSVLALMILLSVLMAAERRFAMAWAIAVIGGMIKPQGLMLLPLLAWWTLIATDGRDWTRSGAAAIGTAVLVIAPFQLAHPWHFIPDVFAESANLFPWGSVNAFNLMLAMGGLVVLDSAKAIGPVSYFELGSFLYALATALAGWIIWRHRTPWFLFYSAFIIYLGMFTFAPRMHERYLFYAVALLAPMLATSGLVAALYGILSATLFLDTAYVFFNFLHIPGAVEGYLPLGPDARFAISITNVAAFGAAAIIGILAVRRSGGEESRSLRAILKGFMRPLLSKPTQNSIEMFVEMPQAQPQPVIGRFAGPAPVRPNRGYEPSPEPPAIGRNFFIFAVVTAVLGAPYFLTQSLHSNFLVYVALALAVCGLFAPDSAAGRAALKSLAVDMHGERWTTFAVFVAFLMLYAVTMYQPNPFNAHVRQAFAFIHGHTWIDAPKYIEHAQFNGQSYQLHPPLPAILLIPFVAWWGMATSQSLFSVVVGAIDVALAWKMLGRLKLTSNARVWLTVFFGMGTIIWSEAVNGGSWEVTMTVAAGFTLAALAELFGEARPWLIGLLAGLAAIARYDLAFVWPLWIALAYLRHRNIRELLPMAPGFALAALVYGAFNFARYGNLFDRGVFVFAPQGSVLFSFKYLAGNLYTLLFMAPNVSNKFPYVHPGIGGQALILTSPAFVLALRPSFSRSVPAILLAMAVISIVPDLFYWTNGFAQFGTRHYVHAFPFLLALMALGLPRGRVDQLTRILIGYSVMLIAFGVWHIGFYGFGG
jgi:Gpi18-like mannosyltransferase